MVKVIQDIWILSESGIVVFHRHFNDKMDEQLFGGLLSALYMFSEEIAKEGLSNFELSDKRFFLQKKNSFLFVASSSKDEKSKKVIQELENIIKSFFELYPENVLENWNGDIRLFLNFEDRIDESLETINTFQKAFW